MLKVSEDLVITIAVAAGLLVALTLTVVAGVWHIHFPPTIIAAFLAVAIAALTYRFLGGVDGSVFSVGLLKLGGSAALLVGLIWFLGGQLREEQKIYESSAVYRLQIKVLEQKLTQTRAAASASASQVRALEKKLTQEPKGRGAYTLEEIKKLPPDDPLIGNIKALVAGQEGPFRPTIRDIAVRIAVIRTQSDTPLFNICEDKLQQLNEGIEVPPTRALLSRSAGEDGEPASITAQRNGRIGADVCEASDRKFDVQINCPVALRLFPDKLSSCAEGVKVKGERISIGALTE